ncbi:hypothetical protein FBU31_002429 [Coemansia sp. 'formosensis']|nr:hypothetical protein FBU31_002429 [Coemansia sp. 'formosensis']
MSSLSAATVKLALSGDSVVLRGAQRGKQAPAERTLSLAFISAPRLGSSKKESADEAFSLESREYLRRRVAGKAVRFSVAYTTASGREFGHVFVGPDMARDNAALMVVREGWARVSDAARGKLSRSDTSDDDRAMIEDLAEAERFARDGRRGMWDEAAKAGRPRLVAFEGDAAEFLAAHRGRELRGTVEMVRDAAALRVMLHLPHAHQMVTVALAGVRAPQASEPFGAEARFNVELRLLQQDVKVRLEAAGHGAPGSFVGSVAHPAGNIAEWLVASGFARVQDWSAAHTADPARLRELEREARAKRLRIWQAEAADVASAADVFEATVVRVVSGDTLVVNDGRSDREFQLASVRQPRAADPATAGYAELAREALRRLCIGRTVSVHVDYHKPAADGFRARDCATVRVRGDDAAAVLVRQGLLGVLRHRHDDDSRSSNYDELQDAEAQATAAKAGMHSGKAVASAKLADASENAARARSFLPHWQRSGRVPCVVDHVAGGARFRLLVAKDAAKLTLVLGGVRCPRAPGRDGEGAEPWGAEALAHAQRHALQRNAEFEIEGVDKAGAFIGSLWLTKDQSLAEDLLRHGLASVHTFSAEQSPHGAALRAAEGAAQDARRGMWADYDAEAAATRLAEKEKERAEPIAVEKLAPRTEFLDVVVSELADAQGRFFVQIVQPDSIAGLESLMAGLALDNNQPKPADFAPKTGQLVAACFEGEWHRARVLKHMPGKREYEVLYVDFGNSDVLPADRIRPLSAKFSAPPSQAHEAQLAFVTLPSESFARDYANDSRDEFRSLVEGRQLVANVEARPHNGPLHLTLYNPELGRPLIEKSVNGLIASAGFAIADKRALSSLHNQAAAAKIDALVVEARNSHRGMWEYGDVTADD